MLKSRTKSDFKQIIKARSDVFNFGKHKGETIELVLKFDPSYILWCDDEKIVKFSEDIVNLADEMDTEQRFSEAMDGQLDGMRFWDIYNDD